MLTAAPQGGAYARRVARDADGEGLGPSVDIYPARLQAYDQVVGRPEQIIPRVLEWIGAGDIGALLPRLRELQAQLIRSQREFVVARRTKVRKARVPALTCRRVWP